jgi:8-oxo-dGTP pyrophosphatase MutT (NUDIX family)
MTGKPLTPRPAATVTLVRDGLAGIEVLMVERSAQSVFVPSNYVFPGGALDPEDGEAADICAGMSDARASHLLGIASGGLAYWVAAIRETFEEVGLLLAYDKAGELVALTDPAAIAHFAARRHDLERRRTTFNAFVREEQLVLAADRMAYFSHWITPEGAPRRYDTRFFVAEAPPAQEPLHDNCEAVSHLWVAPAAALDRHHAGEFKMRFPTVRTLELFAGYDTAAELVAALRRQRPIPAILPRIHADGRRLLPGDPGYEEAAVQRGKYE